MAAAAAAATNAGGGGGGGDPTLHVPSALLRQASFWASSGAADKLTRLVDTWRASSSSNKASHFWSAFVTHAERTTERTPLHLAASAGHADVVRLLVEKGAAWTALDSKGLCAAQLAEENGHDEIVTYLLDAAVRSELVLGAAMRAMRGYDNDDAEGEATTRDAPYLSHKLTFTETSILDETGDAVMMAWEEPLMNLGAQIACSSSSNSTETTCGSILNIGFGMGLVDTAIQSFHPTLHTIIEAHPDVYKRMLDAGWGNKPNVQIVFGRWQDELPKLGKFDGIYFDTYSEDYEDMRELHAALPHHMNPEGVYSYFNGLAPNNEFFAAVYREVCKLELGSLGFEVFFQPVSVQASPPDETSKSTWAELWSEVPSGRRYWHDGHVFYAPVCTFKGEPQDS